MLPTSTVADIGESSTAVKTVEPKKRSFAMMATCSTLVIIANCLVIAFLFLFLSIGSSSGFRLNSQENLPVVVSNGSPFGTTIQLSKQSSVPQNETVPIGTSPSPETEPETPSLPQPFQCPESMFRCTIVVKNNALFQQSQVDQVPRQVNPRIHYICIDQARVCDQVWDCPGGEDEDEIRCPKPKPVEEPAHESEGCYLCKGTHDQCISMSLLCNGHADCPRDDDEHVSICSHKPQSIASGTSSFSTNQFAPTNISIVNTIQDRDHFNDHGQRAGSESIQKRNADGQINTWPISPDADANGGAGQGGVRNGVGFLFRVDNMVIYNSQVKMFNQNSENIAPESDEAAKNATGHGREDYGGQTN